MEGKVHMDSELVDPNQAPSEKMLSQSEVNDLVGKVKKEAAEKERARVLAEQSTAQQFSNQPTQTNNVGMGGMPLDENKIAEGVLNRVMEMASKNQEAQAKAQREQEAHRLVEEYDAKLAQGRERYEDFDQTVSQIQPQEFLDVILLANSMDGTADIMYELAKNPRKLGDVANMLNRSESQAKRMMAEISESMKTNRDALGGKIDTNKPLPRVTPSTAGVGNGDAKSVSDFKKQSWLRG